MGLVTGMYHEVQTKTKTASWLAGQNKFGFAAASVLKRDAPSQVERQRRRLEGCQEDGGRSTREF